MTTTLAAEQTMLSWFVNKPLLKRASIDSFRRMTPRYQWRNPVMFVVYVGSILSTVLWVQALLGQGEAPTGFILAVTLWLWVTPTLFELALLVAVGFLGIFGQWMITHGWTLGDTTALAPLDYLRIVYSALLGYLVFGELPGLWSYAGMALIAASSLYLVLNEARRVKAPPGAAPSS